MRRCLVVAMHLAAATRPPDAPACAAGGCAAEPPVLLQRGASAQRVSTEPRNRYERVSGVGGYGGWCTCPDGQRYGVGDKNDGCARGPASLACIGGTPGDCAKKVEKARKGMQVTCAAAPDESSCRLPLASWPDLKEGVTCAPCTALVLTEPYDGRCDRYCESFGHVCTAAAEEESNNCAVKEAKACGEAITGTSDMLCTCEQPAAAVDQPPLATTASPPSPGEDSARVVSVVGATLAPNAAQPSCSEPSTWPDLKEGVTCELCTALVLTEPYGGRCDRYCESFGHVCMAAAEEESNNCDVKELKACGEAITGTSDMLCTCEADGASALPAPSTPVGEETWRESQDTVGAGWCAARLPAADWDLVRLCGDSIRVSVLSYNLFWWNLFDRRGGDGRSAGRLIEGAGPFDLMGFQECDDVARVLADARLQGSHVALQGPKALAVAYAREAWEELGQGKADVAEDRAEQYYGNRAVYWVRLRHRASGKAVFFLNHHGPLPVNTGGVCGGEATASQILRVAAQKSRPGDLHVIVGDLNADDGSATQRVLNRHLRRATGNWVDAIYSSCPAEGSRNLGKGGSDHDAIATTIVM